MKNLDFSRDYQRQKIEDLKRIHITSQEAFLQMPTGTGKTITALLYAIESLKSNSPKKVTWVVHQTFLVTQSFTDLKNDFSKFGVSFCNNKQTAKVNNISFEFMTWHSLSNSIKEDSHIGSDLLVIDEAHYGASGIASSHKSFKTIVRSNLFKKHLYVSATPWELDRTVYPKILDKKGNVKKEFCAILSMKESTDLNIISDVFIKVVNSADTLKIKNYDGDSEQTLEDSDIKKLSSKVAKNSKICLRDSRSINSLHKSVTVSIIQAYKQLEIKNGIIPPTIIFCSGIKGNPRAITEVSVMLKKALYTPKLDLCSMVSVAHSKLPGDEAQKNIDLFTKGKVKILLVAGMAQEGFNYPNLEVALDLCPSHDNIRRFQQKMGRVIRLKKSPARYYYADTVKNYITSRGERCVLNEETLDKFSKKITKYDSIKDPELVKQITSSMGDLVLRSAALQQVEFGDEEVCPNVGYYGTQTLRIDEDLDAVKSLVKGEKKVVHVSTGGYFISEATNKNSKQINLLKNVSLNDIIRNASDRTLWSMMETNRLIEEAQKTFRNLYE